MKKPSAPVIALAGIVFLLLFAGMCTTTVSAEEKHPSTQASQDWQREFNDVCGKTQDSMIFGVDELRSLVQRCDALEPQIQKLDETRRKVYLRRLQQCRGLYAYVLESKKNDKK